MFEEGEGEEVGKTPQSWAAGQASGAGQGWAELLRVRGQGLSKNSE